MKTIEYQINGSKEIHKFNIEEILVSFKKSSESDNYSKYHYPFSTCLFLFLTKNYAGIQPLKDSQYKFLEKRFSKL